ncbi:Beta-glucosidase [Chitinispirillum alkaliphilum]|nr:Beta-glucosidase [Chitinispirillum alkaliphilum]
MGFKKDFIWGAASSSYQIEGAWNEDGRGLSVWDVFCEKEGAVLNGEHGKVACDHYHRFKDDVLVMKQMGLKAYRFSVSWPRVLPEGTGRIESRGIDFYSSLVDELLEAGITPFPTLFHWDYPYELFCRGGWLNDDSSEWFAEYTSALVEALSDRVENWFTINEPRIFVNLGHVTGTHAPGIKLSRRDILRIIHNVLLSHGKSVKVIRDQAKTPSKIGIAPVCHVAIPHQETAENIELARKIMFSCQESEFPDWSNTWWLDPLFFGSYPEDGLELAQGLMPKMGPDDMKIISQPLDFFATNHYQGYVVEPDKVNGWNVKQPQTGQPLTAFSWPVVPEGLYWGPKFLYERYGKPIVITENGMSNLDWVHSDGKVHDPQRIDYTRRYLLNYKRAASEGVDLMGYFHWSIMDNFEWNQGYKERFGMVYVDFQNQNRIIKDSGHWYRDVIAANGENL